MAHSTPDALVAVLLTCALPRVAEAQPLPEGDTGIAARYANDEDPSDPNDPADANDPAAPADGALTDGTARVGGCRLTDGGAPACLAMLLLLAFRPRR